LSKFTPNALKLRESKKLATTTITNEIAEAVNAGLGFGPTGQAGSVMHRAIVMYAEISSVYKSRAGYYNARSIRDPKALNADSSQDLVEDDLGTVSTKDDLILTNPSEVSTSQALSADDIVPFELIGETADGKGFGRILSGPSSGSCDTSNILALTGSGSSASTTSWTGSVDLRPVSFPVVSRVYFDSASCTLYAFTRTVTTDECGKLVSVTAETRSTVA
jgi:hypothetical protein